MSTKYHPGCTCRQRRCHEYLAPEVLCSGALANRIGDHLTRKGEAEAAGDEAKAKEEGATVAFLEAMLGGGKS